jgi:hypothetical protein
MWVRHLRIFKACLSHILRACPHQAPPMHAAQPAHRLLAIARIDHLSQTFQCRSLCLPPPVESLSLIPRARRMFRRKILVLFLFISCVLMTQSSEQSCNLSHFHPAPTHSAGGGVCDCHPALRWLACGWHRPRGLHRAPAVEWLGKLPGFSGACLPWGRVPVHFAPPGWGALRSNGEVPRTLICSSFSSSSS